MDVGVLEECTVAQLETAARRSRPVPTAEANESHRRRYLRLRWDDDDRFLSVSGRLADAEGGWWSGPSPPWSRPPRPTR